MNLKEIKKKDKTLSLFPLSLSPPFFFSARARPTGLFFFFPREQAGPASPTRLPAGPAPPPSLFF
jgi:hypothetical protein